MRNNKDVTACHYQFATNLSSRPTAYEFSGRVKRHRHGAEMENSTSSGTTWLLLSELRSARKRAAMVRLSSMNIDVALERAVRLEAELEVSSMSQEF